MKKAVLLTLLTFAFAIPQFGEEGERHQSFISYDDGGTMVKSAEDGREIEAQRNLPIFPGDEVITARRGRAEVRLSDGNIIGIDRATALKFRSMLAAYEGEGSETIVELRYGKVGVHRTDIGIEHVRLDTPHASYVADEEAVYSVETDTRGRDRVSVFDGTVEVRTPQRATRLRAGESANVDDEGVFDLIGDQQAGSDDFERWVLQRAEKFGSYNNRYMDRSQAYYADDLEEHGNWVFSAGLGWAWHPYVSVGWRPYYNGYWYNRYGYQTWVSYDPWGWGPYHYGRWAYDGLYGWVWYPGYGYSPAWVYWAYGPGYVGWAPAGWWDCYRPYYGWAYSPYRGYGHDYGYGFYGRVRVSDFDTRPWTFVDSIGPVSTRVDRAALNADEVRKRLGRNRDGYTTVGSGPGRFTREEWNDPAEAVRRRSLDQRGTGPETGAGAVGVADMTPFFRRDADVGDAVRDRVIRSRGGSGSGSTASGVTARSGGNTSVAPIGRGSVAPIGGGSVAPIGGSTAERRGTGSGSGRGSSTGSGTSTGSTVSRGGTTTAPPSGQPADSGSGRVSRGRETSRPADGEATQSTGPNWSDRAQRRNTQSSAPPPASATPSTSEGSSSSGNSVLWRGRAIRNRGTSDGGSSSGNRSSSSGSSTSTSGSSVPRRVVEGVGGARIRPRDSGSSNSGKSSSATSGSSSGRSSSGGSTTRSSSGSGSSGSKSSGGSSTKSSGSSGNSSSSGSSSSGSSSGSSGGSRSSGSGSVKRD